MVNVYALKMSRKTIALCLGVAVCVGYGAWGVSMGSKHRTAAVSERALARRIGVPLVLSDIPRNSVSEDKNAATVYRKIKVLFDQLKSAKLLDPANVSLYGSYKPAGLPNEKILPPATQGQLQKETDDLLPNLKLVFNLSSTLDRYPECDFGLGWFGTSSFSADNFTTMKRLSKDLCARADFQDRHGDWRAALGSMRTVYRISNDAGSDPTIIALLVEVAIREIGLREYEFLLSRHTSDTEFLETLRKQLVAESPLPDIRRHYSGDIVLGRTGLRQLKALPRENRDSQTDSDAEDQKPSPLETAYVQSQPVQDTLEAKFLGAWVVAWNSFPKDAQDWQGFERAIRSANETVQQDRSQLNSVSRDEFSIYVGIPDVVGRLQARDRLLLTSIELLKTRAKSGKLPLFLPDSLGDARVDPFDNAPLRYQRSGNGFALYSIGADRTDDGGRTSSNGVAGTGVDEVVQFNNMASIADYKPFTKLRHP